MVGSCNGCGGEVSEVAAVILVVDSVIVEVLIAWLVKSENVAPGRKDPYIVRLKTGVSVIFIKRSNVVLVLVRVTMRGKGRREI